MNVYCWFKFILYVVVKAFLFHNWKYGQIGRMYKEILQSQSCDEKALGRFSRMYHLVSEDIGKGNIIFIVHFKGKTSESEEKGINLVYIKSRI